MENENFIFMIVSHVVVRLILWDCFIINFSRPCVSSYYKTGYYKMGIQDAHIIYTCLCT